jgi:cell fate (sporulation/competence/biofilm development) regulator YlbF (YheA/YmcA/DUF963 family)
MSVYDKAHELAKELKLSQEVMDFKKANEKLNANEVNKKIVDDIKRLQFQMYNLQMQGQQPPKEQMDNFNNLMKVISMNLEIREFLEAEMRFQRMFQGVMKIIGDASGIEQTMGPK